MKIQQLFIIVCVCFAVTPAVAQYAIPPPSGNACEKITREKIRVFENQLRGLLRIAEQDKKPDYLFLPVLCRRLC
jgi:hypothetical protein